MPEFGELSSSDRLGVANAMRVTGSRDWLQHLRQRSTLVQVGANASWLLVERMLELALRFIVGTWVVRYLGPEQYGVFSYSLSYVALFAVIATLGLNSIVVRELAKKRVPAGSILGTTFVIQLASGLATFGLIAAIVVGTEKDWLTRVAVLLAAGALPFRAADVFDLWFQSQIQSKYAVWTRAAITVLFSGLRIAGIVLGLPLLAFLGTPAVDRDRRRTFSHLQAGGFHAGTVAARLVDGALDAR
jgi:O-antigen/teichoic acid export membrane protein